MWLFRERWERCASCCLSDTRTSSTSRTSSVRTRYTLWRIFTSFRWEAVSHQSYLALISAKSSCNLTEDLPQSRKLTFILSVTYFCFTSSCTINIKTKVEISQFVDLQRRVSEETLKDTKLSLSRVSSNYFPEFDGDGSTQVTEVTEVILGSHLLLPLPDTARPQVYSLSKCPP